MTKKNSSALKQHKNMQREREILETVRGLTEGCLVLMSVNCKQVRKEVTMVTIQYLGDEAL